MRTRGGLIPLLFLVALSTPAALAAEAAMRRFFLPPVFEELREWAQPTATAVAWGLFGLAFVATGLGFALQRRLFLRSLARPRTASPDPQARARFEALLIAASVPQIPALLAAIASMFGARWGAVVAAVAVASLGVVAQGVMGMRLRAPRA